MRRLNDRRGFSLIELLIVVFVVVALSSVALVAMGSSRIKARNAQRLTDLGSIQFLLEAYYDDHGKFPLSYSQTWANAAPQYTFAPCSDAIYGDAIIGDCWYNHMPNQAGFSYYVANTSKPLPVDPKNPHYTTGQSSGQLPYGYYYAVGFKKTSATTAQYTGLLTDYILATRLEAIPGEPNLPTIAVSGVTYVVAETMWTTAELNVLWGN